MDRRFTTAAAAAALLACHPVLHDDTTPSQPQSPGPTDAGPPTPASPVTVPARTGPVSCTANCLYVDASSGSDDADGHSPGTAWRTLKRAAAGVQPGSTVLVMSGTYTTDGGEEPLLLKTSGTASAWITFAAAPGHHPVIQLPRGSGAYNGIHLFGVAYVIIDGFEVIGQNGSITADEASKNDGTQAVLNEGCVYIDGIGSPAERPSIPHDIVVRNSDLHHCSSGGVVAGVADSLTIAYNQVHDNGWWTVLGTSGLGAYHLTDAPGATTTGGYRNFIVGNVVYGNRNNLPWNGAGRDAPGIYDGNGIIIDDGNHGQPALGQSDVQGVPYTGRTYVANNVSHDNGGRGVHVYSSAHVDIVNNTTYNNMLTSSPHISFGEIDAQSSQDVTILNNVAVNLNGKDANLNDGNLYDYNVWQGASVPFHGVHDVLSDAGLTNPGAGDFAPHAGSPAVAAGTGRAVPTLDMFGNPRPTTGVDRGAIQVTR